MFGCKKPAIDQPIPPVQPENKTRLKVLWQKPIHPDTLEVFGMAPLELYGDFIYQRCGPPSPTPLVRRNGDTGTIVWEWSDFFKYNIEAAFEGYLVCQGNKLVLSDGFGYYGIDGNNGTTIWKDNISNKPDCSQASTGSVQLQQYAFTTHSPCGVPFAFDTYLVRYFFETGQLDTVCHVNGGDSLFVGISGLSQVVDNFSGDTIVIITNNGLKNNPPKSNQTIYQAYNLNKKNWIWSWSDPSIKNGGTANTVIGKRLYLQTAQKLICLDLETRDLLWQRDYKVPNSAGLSRVLEYKNQLIVKRDDEGLEILDPATGNLIWQTLETGATPIGGVKLFEGVLYFTSAGDGRIYAVDLDTRQILWSEPSPNLFYPKTDKASFFMAGVAIDTINRRLFTCDKYYAMSIKLPK